MFELLEQHGSARRGEVTLAHGTVQTPCFMPIATKGAVKTLDSQDLSDLGAQIVLSNTYHLLLKPGLEAMKQHGGLHTLMNWHGPMLTDSGGYQVFSLSRMNKTTEDGVTFHSHINGDKIHLTPELSIAMQEAIGADIMMQFDDVAKAGASRARVEQAMRRSIDWAARCKEAKTSETQKLFGIVQGGIFEDLRIQSAQALIEQDLDGYAIGGLSVGEARADAYRITKTIADILPSEKPRYFMGGGMPEEIVYYVNAGVDMFDCVIPTRNARHGTLFVWNQDPADVDWSTNPTDFYSKARATNEEFQFDDAPIDPHCDCPTCKTTSRAYLRHLFGVKEVLAHRLATRHNLAFYLRLMRALRTVIN